MCLLIFSNGCRGGKGTHISLFVTPMAGKYDDQLEWPFLCEIDVDLLNWRMDEGHYMITMPLDNDGFNKVTEGMYGGSY